jgi:hypothetical protein
LPGAVADGVFVWMLQDEHVASAGDAATNAAKAREAARRLCFHRMTVAGRKAPSRLEDFHLLHQRHAWRTTQEGPACADPSAPPPLATLHNAG